MGVAFLLIGQLKSKLQHREGARVCFRLALKYNPFLWSAFEALCETEGSGVTSLNVKDFFKVLEYPNFLRPNPLAPPISSQTIPAQAKPGNVTAQGKADLTESCPEFIQDEVESGSMQPLPKGIPNSAHLAGSGNRCANTSAKKLKKLFMTPDLFNNASVGQAIASSTPSVPKNMAMRDRLLPPSLGAWSDEVGGARDGMDLSQPAMGPVKLALDFGSTTSKGSGHGLSPGMTPLHPRWVD